LCESTQSPLHLHYQTQYLLPIHMQTRVNAVHWQSGHAIGG